MEYAAIVREKNAGVWALEAGDLIMEIYDGPDFEVMTKSDNSPVTRRRRGRRCPYRRRAARGIFPASRWCTEEQGESHDVTAATFLHRGSAGRDEGIHQPARGDFTVNIARVEEGVPTRGVVFAPAKDGPFYTRGDGRSVEETGAFVKDVPGDLPRDRRLRPGQWRADGGGVEITPRRRDRRLYSRNMPCAT